MIFVATGVIAAIIRFLDAKGACTVESSNTPIWAKLLISFVSLIFFLALLEFSLWAVGRIFYDRSEKDLSFVITPDNSMRILCVGDSFTHGGLVKKDESYPALLQAKLDEKYSQNRFDVINQGVCESNTLELKRYLPKLIKRYRPHLVILLAGSANRFNPWDYDLHRDGAWTSKLKSWALNLRVVKMVRITWINVFSLEASAVRAIDRYNYNLDGSYQRLNEQNQVRGDCRVNWRKTDDDLIRQPIEEIHDPMQLMRRYFFSKEYDKALEVAERVMEQDNSTDAWHAVQEFKLAIAIKKEDYVSAERLATEILKKFKGNVEIERCLGDYYQKVGMKYITQNDHGRAAELLLKGISLSPGNEGAYYWLTKSFDFQSRYTAEMVVEKLETIQKREANRTALKLLKNYQAIFTDKDTWDREVEEWIRSDLEDIVSLLGQYNIPVVFQNYPVSYPLANSILEDVASEHDLPFVNNLSVFKDLSPRSMYILDDDHCSAAGHSVMVDNILKVLESKELLAP